MIKNGLFYLESGGFKQFFQEMLLILKAFCFNFVIYNYNFQR